jgi:hypothetical protein
MQEVYPPAAGSPTPLGALLGAAWARARALVYGRPFRLGRALKLSLLGLFCYSTGYAMSLCSRSASLGSLGLRQARVSAAAPATAALAALDSAVLAVALGVGLLVSVALLYLAARSRAALVRVVAAGEGRLRPALGATRAAAHRYFLLLLALSAAACLALGALTAPLVWAALRGRSSSVAQTLVSTLVSLSALLLWAFVDALLQDTLLPLLVLEPGATVAQALRRLNGLVSAAPARVLGYLLLRVLAVFAVALGLGLLAALATFAVGGLALLAGWAAYSALWAGSLAAHTVFFALAGLLVLPVLGVGMFAGLLAYGLAGTFQACCGTLFASDTFALLPPAQLVGGAETPAAAAPLPRALW